MEEEKKYDEDLEKNKEDIDKMSIKDMYKLFAAKAADERDAKKKSSLSFIKKIIDKFTTTKNDEDAITEEESNDKPKK